MALGSQGGLSTPNASEASQFVVKDFNFAVDKKTTANLSSQDGITFTRSGASYYVNQYSVLTSASTGEPVYGYDGSTSIGMRIEKATTNRVRGTALDNSSYWGTYGGYLQGTNSTGPDDVSASGKRVEGEDANGLINYHAIWDAGSVTNGTSTPHRNNWSGSVWARPGNAAYMGMFFSSGSKVGAAFHLNGDGSIVNSDNCTPSIERHGDWYLCKCENISNISGSGVFGFTPSKTSALVWNDSGTGSWYQRTDFFDSETGGPPFFVTTYTPNYIYLYGPQFEDSTTCTSYMPNTSNATDGVTRNPDVVSITEPNFSNFYNQSQGTFLVEGRRSNAASASSSPTLLEVNNNSDTDTMAFNASATKEIFAITDAGGSANIEAGDDIAKNTAFKISGGYKAGSYATSLNGAAAVSNSFATVPTPDRMLIGNSTIASGRELNGHISRIRYWRRRTPDSYLKKIST